MDPSWDDNGWDSNDNWEFESAAGDSPEVLYALYDEAVSRARAGDVVLVAGKGHETGQEIRGVVHPFDDREVVREVLRR